MSNKKRRENQCIECNKFRRWEDLTVDSFTPDSAFTIEDTTYVCRFCNPKAFEDQMDMETLRELEKENV